LKILKILIILIILVQTIYAISLDAGINYFPGELSKQIKTAPYIGAELGYGLSDYTSLYLQATFNYLKLKENKDFHGLYQFVGRAGVESSEELFKYASAGIGISMAGVRGENATPQAENYMLSTSETEFGWNARLKLNLFRIEKFTFGTKFHYDEIWTKPKNSSLVQAGVFVSYDFSIP
jgi:hypothetical protein